jgi:hypothetical protein
MSDDPKIRAVASRIREQQKDLERYEKLEKILKFMKEHAADLQVTVRFGASAVAFHDDAAQYVREFYFNDWAGSGRRQTITAVENEMKLIKERLGV